MNEFYSFLMQIISVFLAFSSIIVTIVLYFRSTKIKKLQYKIISEVALVNETLSQNKLHVMFDNEQIQNATYIELMIVNNGSASIECKDIERNISIALNEGSRILSSEIKETKPESLRVSIEDHHNNNKIILERVLLNPGDMIVLKMIACDFNKLTLDCRISGVKSIDPVKEKQPLNIVFYIFLIIIIFILVLFGSTDSLMSIIKIIFICVISIIQNKIFMALQRKPLSLLTMVITVIIIFIITFQSI